MGMYDELICRRPLPGKVPAFIEGGHRFQTKSFDCQLAVYEITPSGQLTRLRPGWFDESDSQAEEVDFTGQVDFYTTNLTGAGPGLYTREGEDAETVQYQATFAGGALTDLTLAVYERRPSLPSHRQMAHRRRLTPEAAAELKAERDRSRLGEQVYVLPGGQESGYWAEVVAEDEKQWCLRNPEGVLEMAHRVQFNSTVFATEEAAWAERAQRKAEWQAAEDEYAALVQERGQGEST